MKKTINYPVEVLSQEIIELQTRISKEKDEYYKILYQVRIEQLNNAIQILTK